MFSTALPDTERTLRVTIVVASVHHRNTQRVAESLATALSADLLTAETAADWDPCQCDLVGLGSGIYFGRHHASLRRLVRSWAKPPQKVFLFSTAGLPFLRFFQHMSLRRMLRRRGSEIVGEFCCRGWDTVGPLWILGGINRRHPNQRDLERAEKFAVHLVNR